MKLITCSLATRTAARIRQSATAALTIIAMLVLPITATRIGAAGDSPSISPITDDGGRLDWNPKEELLAFDRRDTDGYFDIYTMTTAGSDVKCLTCDKPGLPNKNIGNPVWHPSGNYLAFQAQNSFFGFGAVTDYFANPGAGVNNDLWIMDKDGNRFWQLTTVPVMEGGVLHPQFSRNGDKLLWAERLSSTGGEWGTWALKVADFTIDPGGNPRIENIRMLQPGVQHKMYESHGFSPDGGQILFSGNLEAGQLETEADIYLYDLSSGALTNLTQTMDEWDEHAHFSPDGSTIVWMSNKAQISYLGEVRTDYWMMNPDGSNKRRLTYFNDPKSPQYIKGRVIAADSSWSPDGRRLATYLITNVTTGGINVMVGLPGGPVGPAPPVGIRITN